MSSRSCPSAAEVGRIVGVANLIRASGSRGETPDGIVCHYVRDDDLSYPDSSGLGTHLPAPDNASVGIAQIHAGHFLAAQLRRTAGRLLTQSNPLHVELGDSITVTARYMLNPGRPRSAWLLAESAYLLNYLSIKAAIADDLSPNQATQQLRALAQLVNLDR